jgi:lipopolysaccharide export system protein LptA
MTTSQRPFFSRLIYLTMPLCALTLSAGLAHAEKADKNKAAIIDSAKVSVNEQTQTRVFEGNVAIVKGTMAISAERVELKIDAEGYQTMLATGTMAKPATFKQKREGLDETVEAQSVTLVFDGKADTILLTDQAIVRRLAKGVPQDEVRGAVIKYFNQTEFYEVKGGPTSSDDSGRVRTTLAPRLPAATTAPASK